MAEPGGRILVRVPISLHAALVERAEREGVSLNHLVVALLAGGIEFKPGLVGRGSDGS